MLSVLILRSASIMQYNRSLVLCVLQNTIADIKSFVPTLEKAFSVAEIPERDSWVITSATILSNLEDETKAIRKDHTPAVQQQLSAIEQHPSRIGVGKVAFPDEEQYKSSDIGGFELVLVDAAKAANDASKVGKGKKGILVLNEPQEADDGDDDEEEVDVSQNGKKDTKNIVEGIESKSADQRSKDWTGSVL